MTRQVSLPPRPDSGYARRRLQPGLWAVVRWLAVAAGIVAVGYGLLFLVVIILWSWPQQPRSHLRDWPQFYQSDVSPHFKIPPSAQIVQADDMPQFMGQEVRIRFRLPETKTPSAWVEHVATSSGIPVRYREDPLHYNGPGDYNLVSYDQATGLYEVVYGWD